MLGKLSEDDMRRTIESLKLTDDGTPQEVLTMEEYRQHTIEDITQGLTELRKQGFMR